MWATCLVVSLYGMRWLVARLSWRMIGPSKASICPALTGGWNFPDFWHRPTRLKRWCRTVLTPQKGGDYTFRIATCGGVHIWVDGELAAKFEPFSRNSEQSTEVTLSLKAGGSDVVMLAEDLAERDINWYVEFTLLGPDPIRSAVPGEADPDLIDVLMALARDVRPETEFSSGNPLVLVVDQPPIEDVMINARVLPSVHMRDKPPLLDCDVVLKAGECRVEVGGLDGMPDAYHALDLTFQIGEDSGFPADCVCLVASDAAGGRGQLVRSAQAGGFAVCCFSRGNACRSCAGHAWLGAGLRRYLPKAH